MKNDFHTHCLPGIDDGAPDISTALAMLRAAHKQGIRTVVATPHFYAGEKTMDEFLTQRNAAASALRAAIAADRELAGRIRLLLGAEVLVREGVSELDLRPLCLEGTETILLELPFMCPPSFLVDELEAIFFDQRLIPMMAHIDRYMPWYSRERIADLLDYPDLIVQLNASSLADRRMFKHLTHWLPEDMRLVIGSDMHDMRERAPQMDAAIKQMSHHRVGREWLGRMEETGADVLERNA